MLGHVAQCGPIRETFCFNSVFCRLSIVSRCSKLLLYNLIPSCNFSTSLIFPLGLFGTFTLQSRGLELWCKYLKVDAIYKKRVYVFFRFQLFTIKLRTNIRRVATAKLWSRNFWDFLTFVSRNEEETIFRCLLLETRKRRFVPIWFTRPPLGETVSVRESLSPIGRFGFERNGAYRWDLTLLVEG